MHEPRNRAAQLQVGATIAITVHVQRARRFVEVLDTVVAARFEHDEARLAEWRQAKRVQLKPGPKRQQGVMPEASAGVPTTLEVMEPAQAAPALELVAA